MYRDDVRDDLLGRGPEGYVYPDYDGYCFHRVVPTLLDLLGGDVDGDLTLPADVLGDEDRDFDRVLLLFVDGFGDDLWHRHADDPLLSAFESAGRVTPLTTTYPSETAAAVTSHHTGLTTADHGAIGWDQWVERLGETIQTLPFTVDEEVDAGSVGATADDLFVGDSLYGETGVDVTLIQPESHSESTYTRAATAGATRFGYEGLDDFERTTREAIESPNGPALVDSYLPHVDAVAHASGHDSDPFREEVDRVFDAIRSLLSGISDAKAERTLVVLTADHGLVDTNPETNVDVRDLDGVWEHLRTHEGEPIPPAGSGRNVHLFVEQGHLETVREAVERQVDCLTFTREEAIEEELYGPTTGERFRERCGDLVVVPRDKTVWHDPAKLQFVGMHGGLAPEEMLVPFAAAGASNLTE